MRAIVCLVVLALASGCSRAPAPVTLHPADAIPERLSEWHLLAADGRSLALNAGVMPYDLNTPLFTDYALKLRTLWMPDGKAARYREDRELDFPVGTILTKTFHYRYGERGFERRDAETELAADPTTTMSLPLNSTS